MPLDSRPLLDHENLDAYRSLAIVLTGGEPSYGRLGLGLLDTFPVNEVDAAVNFNFPSPGGSDARARRRGETQEATVWWNCLGREISRRGLFFATLSRYVDGGGR